MISKWANLERNESKGTTPSMLNWPITYFVIALIAAVFAFSSIAEAATQIVWSLSLVFFVLFIVAITSR